MGDAKKSWPRVVKEEQCQGQCEGVGRGVESGSPPKEKERDAVVLCYVLGGGCHVCESGAVSGRREREREPGVARGVSARDSGVSAAKVYRGGLCAMCIRFRVHIG